MATQVAKTEIFLYLDRVALKGDPKLEYELKLIIADEEIKIERKDNQTWAPVQHPEVFPTSKVEIQIMGGLDGQAKNSQVIDLKNIFDGYWSSNVHEFASSTPVILGDHHWSLELLFSASATAVSMNSSLRRLEELLERYSKLMKGSTERIGDKDIEYGVALSEATFSVASVMSELLEDQNKYDQTLSGFLDPLKRVLPLSLSGFLVSNDRQREHQINPQDANAKLGVACLDTMFNELRFNICKLEDSRLANADIEDLPSRIKQDISDPLLYSCLYWSNHLCFAPDGGDQHVWAGLKKFFEGAYPLFWIEVLSVTGMVTTGVASLRRLISWVKDADHPLLERIQDVYYFITTFYTPISISVPHIYISTRPFLPSQSPLSAIFSTLFARAIKLRSGKLQSWGALPLEWNDANTVRTCDAKMHSIVGESSEAHTDSIYSMACSPDGWRVASGAGDQSIRIWDINTGSLVGQPLEGHIWSVFSIAYSRDGRRLVSGSWDSTIQIWDAESGEMLGEPLEGHTDGIWMVAFSPDGRRIASGAGDRTIRIWDVETGSVICEPLKGHTHSVCALAYSPDGRRIVSGCKDKSIRIWDAESGTAVGAPVMGHTSSICSVTYSPDGRFIASASDDYTIRIWDAETGSAVGEPLKGHTNSVCYASYSPDGRHIVSGSWDKTIRIWDAETGLEIGGPLEGHAINVCSVAYSPDGRRILSASWDKTIRVWDADDAIVAGKPQQKRADNTPSVTSSPGAHHVTTGSPDGKSFAQLPSSCDPEYSNLRTQPDTEGWVRDSEGRLLYWVPPDCRSGLHSPALLTIPLDSHFRSVSLDFEDCALGILWTEIYKGIQA